MKTLTLQELDAADFATKLEVMRRSTWLEWAKQARLTKSFVMGRGAGEFATEIGGRFEVCIPAVDSYLRSASHTYLGRIG